MRPAPPTSSALPVAAALALALCFSLAPAAAAAAPGDDDEDADLALFFGQDDVRAASLAPRPAPRAPATVTILTADDLEAWGDRSVADALSRVAGLSVVDDGVLPDVGIRGVHTGAGAPSRILKVMIDGRPVSDRVSDAALLGPDLLPIEAVERIEVVRGPLSALYGANAFLGAVNVVTRSGGGPAAGPGRARLSAWKGRGRLEGASLGVAGGLRDGPLDLLLAFGAAADRRDGRAAPQSSPSLPALLAEDRRRTRDDDAGHVGLFAKATLDGGPGGPGQLALDASLRGLDRSDPFEDRTPLPASGTTRVAWAGGEVRLTGRTDLTEDLGAEAFVGWAGGRTGRGDRLEAGAPDAFLRRRVGHDGVQGGASLRQRLGDAPLLGPGALSLAADGAWDHIEAPTWQLVRRSSGGGGRAGDATALQPRRVVDVGNGGVAAEAAFGPAPWLDVTAGGRVDRHSVYGTRPAARLALVADVTDSLTAKALGGTSFLAPSPELLFGRTAGPGDIVGNPRLRPQAARSGEAALGWRPAPGLAVEVAGFAARVDDLVVLQRRGLNLAAENGATLDSLGAEVEVSAARGPVVVRAGAAWVRARVDATAGAGEPLLSAERPAQVFPGWSGGFGASWRLPSLNLALHVDGRWAGPRPSSDENALIAEAPYDLAGFFVADAAVTTEGWRPFGGPEVAVRAEVMDVADERPADPGLGGVDLPSLGRRFALTLEQRF